MLLNIKNITTLFQSSITSYNVLEIWQSRITVNVNT